MVKKQKKSVPVPRQDNLTVGIPETQGNAAVEAATTKLRVFISWSGQRSKALAEALRQWCFGMSIRFYPKRT
jgi:hypothetical protein